MKPTSLILLIFCHYACAQKIQEKFSSNGVKYTLSEIGTNNKRGSVIRNAANMLFKDKHKPPKALTDSYFSAISFDKESADIARNLITKAFVAAGKPIPNKNIYPWFFIDPNGKILEIDFMSMDSSQISVDDINLIEKTLINKFTFKTKTEQLKGIPVIKFFWPIKWPKY